MTSTTSTIPHTATAPAKPTDIVDREKPWDELATAWLSGKPELLIGLGRRRAGKSFVLARFAKAVGGVYYQATKNTEKKQLTALTKLLGTHFADPALKTGRAFDEWEELFAYLNDKIGNTPFLLVLDEFPYLAEAAKALPSIIQDQWDHHWPSSRVRVVLNGSHVTAMVRLENADQPLYGRRTARLMFPPLYVEHVRDFVPAYTPIEVITTYGIFGGLPGYLTLLDPQQNLAANVQRLILDPNGRLADDAQHVLDAFLSEADVHYTIIATIAAGERTWNKLTQRSGMSGGSLLRPLRWLEEMRFVSRRIPITEGEKSKRVLYTVTDPYISFWHEFVAPLVQAGQPSVTTPELLWRGHVEPALNTYMGGIFEQVCRDWVARTTRLPFQPTATGSWWDAASDNELDIVALGPNDEVMVGECKWGAFDHEDLKKLRDRAALLRAELPKRFQSANIHYVCFSANNTFTDAVRGAAEQGLVTLFTAADVINA